MDTGASRNPLGRGMNRRQLLRIGGLGAFGMNLSGLLRAEAASPSSPASVGSGSKIKSCILVFYYGGPSHHETWDMKPNAPREVRGEFNSIATSVPGIRIGEHQPHSAKVVDRLAIIRSVHHPMTNHNAAAFATLSGRPPLKGDLELLGNDRNDPPCLGSALSHQLPERPGLPTFVALPHVMHNVVQLPGQIAGFLGSAHNPFQLTRDPNATDFRLDELELPGDVSLDRLEHRASLLEVVDNQLRQGDKAAAGARDLDTYNAKAFRLLRSESVRRAFHIESEDPKLRDRYGRTKHGQSMLLARRLVESGVRFVSVYDHEVNGQLANWDSHSDVFPRHKNDLLPPADRAFAALIDDLTERGLLESTLVIAMGEFGRTPKINATAGRDHWPYCYSVVMAGGGVRGGVTYGASDKLGAYPDTDPVTPADIAATLFWRFGLDPESEIVDLTGRPYRLADGAPIRGLFPA
ncbi:DUF1501 domain-containing protein [Singulisphaera sp. PoT]|uniref:DUF1501 domain-containing protein n=1 Tax=Singulisphaera sp. PoT TaxID=3411797 RepID=UPI003BF60661